MKTFNPKVGDRVRRIGEHGAPICEVLGVTQSHMWLYVPGATTPITWPVNSAWEVVPSFPERWFNVYPDGTIHAYTNVHMASGRKGPIGTIHLSPDGTVEMVHL